jgi:hypothetical protein
MKAAVGNGIEGMAVRAQVSAGTAWTNHVGNEEGHAVAPTLTAVPLRVGGLPGALLAAGAHSAVVLSKRGRVLDELELPVRRDT